MQVKKRGVLYQCITKINVKAAAKLCRFESRSSDRKIAGSIPVLGISRYIVG